MQGYKMKIKNKMVIKMKRSNKKLENKKVIRVKMYLGIPLELLRAVWGQFSFR